MSDQDNLRNRIAEVIHRTKSPLHDHGQAQAQAVIDELGLQVLEVDRVDLINGTVASYQIVGKWDN